jgi:hypothetical protein
MVSNPPHHQSIQVFNKLLYDSGEKRDYILNDSIKWERKRHLAQTLCCKHLVLVAYAATVRSVRSGRSVWPK